MIPGTTIKRTRDDARYRVSSVADDGMHFIVSADGSGWPSMWETAATLRAEYEIVSLPRDISEQQAQAALTTGAQREHVRAYVREAQARDALADKLGYEPDELPRDRPGMWTSVPFKPPR